MKSPRFLFYITPIFLLYNVHAQTAGNKKAREILLKTSLMLGSGWDTVRSVKVQGYGTHFLVDQSERYEGPYISDQFTRALTFDVQNNRALAEYQVTTDYFGPSPATTFILDNGDIARKDGDKLSATPPDDELQDQILFRPDYLVKTALNNVSLIFQKDTVLQKKPVWILHFSISGFPVRLFINKETNLLTATEVVKPHPGNFGIVWGDVRKMIYYSFWVLPSANVHYPAQEDVYLNDYYLETYLATQVDINMPFSRDSLLAIPENIKAESRDFDRKTLDIFKKSMDAKAKEIAKDVWVIPGPCNTTVVKQNDGLVAIESSLSSEYGEAIIQEVKKIFPGEKIKAFIATSDAWFHLGGIRAFAALNIPIYFPYLNKPLLEKVLHAPYITHPDSLAIKKYHSYSLHEVKNMVTIGNGDNTIRLCPYKTETGDRMMMVYFPLHKILYCSDLYQPKGGDGKYWQPHYAWEVYHSIKEYKLPVKKFYAMHQANLIDFSDLEKDFAGQ